MKASDIREELYLAMEKIGRKEIDKLDYLYLVEGAIVSYDKINGLYTFMYQGEEYSAVSLTGERYKEGDVVYVLFSKLTDIKKVIVTARDRYSSFQGALEEIEDGIMEIESIGDDLNEIQITVKDWGVRIKKTEDQLSQEIYDRKEETTSIKKDVADANLTIKDLEEDMGIIEDQYSVISKTIEEHSSKIDQTSKKIEQEVKSREESIKYLEKEIETIELTPGPKGDTGPQGPPGKDGQDGVPGRPGKDGQALYTWIKYADTPTSGMSDDPTGKKYVGFSYNNESKTESNDYSKYEWQLVKGEDGKPGINGEKGKDGKIFYNWIMFADSPTTGISENPDGKKYVGYAFNKEDPKPSLHYNDYKWQLVKGKDGKDGPQGIPGKPGADGKTTYTWIMFADTPTSGINANPAGKKYVGYAFNKTSSTPSTNYADYKWQLVKGEDGKDGKDGIPGKPGADGKTKYTWVKYADDENGKGMSDNPNGKFFIGLAFDKEKAKQSTNPKDYSWSWMPQNLHYGKYRYKETIIVKGDPHTYYPVILTGGDQTFMREIYVARGYAELAPPDWNTATHRGGLSLLIKANFGGWGGAQYVTEIHELNEQYSTMFMGTQNNLMIGSFAIFLRGGGDGGARYHLYSNETLYYDGTYKDNGSIPPAPQVCLENDVYTKSGDKYIYKAPDPRKEEQKWLDQISDMMVTAKKIKEVEKTTVENSAGIKNLDDQVKIHANKITTTEKGIKDLDGKITQTQKDVKDQSARIDVAYNKIESEVKERKESVLAVDKKVDEIEVGGRNYLRDSNRPVETAEYEMADYYLTDELREGEIVTISMKAILGEDRSHFGLYNSGGTVAVASLLEVDLKDGVYSKSFVWRVASASNKFLRVYHMNSSDKNSSSIEWIKLERGNKATDWTIAPEDVDEKVRDLEADNIRLIDSVEEHSTIINQTAQGLETEIAERIEANEQMLRETTQLIEASADALEISFSEMYGKEIKDLDSSLEDLRTYYRLSKDGAVIGKDNSPLQITISNEQIDFIDNGEATAYINGQKMYITSLEVLNDIILGEHQWSTYSGSRGGSIITRSGK